MPHCCVTNITYQRVRAMNKEEEQSKKMAWKGLEPVCPETSKHCKSSCRDTMMIRDNIISAMLTQPYGPIIYKQLVAYHHPC